MGPEFKNVLPVDDEFEALELLINGGGFQLNVFRMLVSIGRSTPYVEIQFYDGRGSKISTDYYAVTPGVVERLRRREFIEGEPYWGGRSRCRFLPSPLGQAFWTQTRNDAARICHE